MLSEIFNGLVHRYQVFALANNTPAAFISQVLQTRHLPASKYLALQVFPCFPAPSLVYTLCRRCSRKTTKTARSSSTRCWRLSLGKLKHRRSPKDNVTCGNESWRRTAPYMLPLPLLPLHPLHPLLLHLPLLLLPLFLLPLYLPSQAKNTWKRFRKPGREKLCG